MPFPMKIQPIEEPARSDPVKPVVKSRLKRLLERQFNSVLRISAAEKVAAAAESEPSSVCLDKMVQNFLEESNEKQSGAVRCGRNCFNRSCNDSSEDELDSHGGSGDSSSYAAEALKSLVLCSNVNERTLLADTAKIVEKNNICKRKDDFCRRIVTEGLVSLGYDASICKSRWEKCPSYPAGEYEYIDVLIQGERLLVDIDFRSEFEIARSTKAYRAVLNGLPYIFVGKSDRLQKIIGVVSDAAKQSLKKKGMHVPPWRKAVYVKAKWLSPHTRLTPSPVTCHKREVPPSPAAAAPESNSGDEAETEFEESLFAFSESPLDGETYTAEKRAWKPPDIKSERLLIGANKVTGFASVTGDKPGNF